MSETKKILICCTGSVATIQLPLIITQLENAVLEKGLNYELSIQVVLTEAARHFFKQDEIPENITVYRDEDEWAMWNKRGDPVLHIDLGKWADLAIIAPLDANTMAKIANGLCDNLVTCVVRAWDISKPLLFCPAMNTRMWDHPITKTHVSVLVSWGYKEIPCVAKTLMCGDTGMGAMALVPTIIEEVLREISEDS